MAAPDRGPVVSGRDVIASSRESYATALERLSGLGADPAVYDAVGEELLAVASMLSTQPSLRRALTDPSRSPADRAALLTQLLSGKVRVETSGVLSDLVSARWASGADLLDQVERLGVDALLLGADRAGLLADVEDGLFRFVQVVDGSPQLAAALGDVTAETSRRTSLVRELLSGKADRYTERLAELAVTGFGGRSFIAGLAKLVELAAERRERQVAYVTVAGPLTDAEEQRLGARLSAIYDRPVSLKVTVDPHVLGGVSVLVGADLYDGTVLRRLDRARNALAGS